MIDNRRETLILNIFFFKDEMDDCLIIIFIAETDPDYVYQISSDIQKQFQKHLGKQFRLSDVC